MSVRTAPISIVMAAACVACAACGDGSSAGHEVKAPYTAWSDATRALYTMTTPDGKTSSQSCAAAGDKTVGDKTYKRFRISDTSAPESGTEVWATRVDSSTLEIAGAEYETSRSAVLGIPIYASGTLDQPVRISIDPPVGQPQTVTLAGQRVIGKGSSPEAGSVTVTYTLKEKGVAVETPSGLVAGCHHFEASGDVPLLFGAASTTVRGELWYSPTLGLVKAQLTAPISLGLGFAGNSDLTDLGDGWAAVQKTGAVGKDAAKTWELSTYDFRQQFDADKDTHAKMLLEVRWVDSAKAKGQQQPYLQEEFGTTMGYFPSTMTQSPVSIFHPEENGQGFVYWIGFVDQAAKNQAVNGISYRISLNRYDPSFSAVRATGRIIYKRFGP